MLSAPGSPTVLQQPLLYPKLSTALTAAVGTAEPEVMGWGESTHGAACYRGQELEHS